MNRIPQLDPREFNYSALDTVVTGEPVLSALPRLADKLQARRLFLIASSSLATHTEQFAALRHALGSRCVGLFDRVSAHTPRDDVLAALQAARDAEADLLVSLGGGSIIDACKVVQLAIDQNIETETELVKYVQRADGSRYASLKTESIREEVEQSLRRLNVDVIDLYQIHRPRPDEEIEEGWGAIADLIKEGKIRYGGVSNFTLDQLRRVQAIHPVASLQPVYSMLMRDIEAELLDYCAANDIGVIPYSPMQSGLLTGKFTREHIDGLPATDWRRGQRPFKEPNLTASLAFVDKLRPIAARYGRPLGQLAIAWALRRPDITAVIVGARRPSQIKESAPAGDWVLPDDVLAEIEQLLAENIASNVE